MVVISPRMEPRVMGASTMFKKSTPQKKCVSLGQHNVSMFCGICGHIVFISKFACVKSTCLLLHNAH